jgi:hypothetical protein
LKAEYTVILKMDRRNSGGAIKFRGTYSGKVDKKASKPL